MEQILARFLRFGSWASCGLLGLGILARWLDHFPPQFSNLAVACGIGLLIALPALRVSIMFGLFVRKRDYLFAALAAFVLLIIVLSLLAGATRNAGNSVKVNHADHAEPSGH